MKSVVQLKHVVSYYAFLLVVWGFYRLIFKLPESVEELVFKPLIWLLPLFYILKKEKLGISSVGFTGENFWKSVYLALGLGILFAIAGVLVNSLKYGNLNFLNLSYTPQVLVIALFISLVTAVSEETAFRGFIFNRLWKASGREWISNILTSFGWAMIHIPVTVFVLNYSFPQVSIFLFLSFLFGVGSAFVFARTGNIVSSILLHVFWGWPIILFR